MTMVRALIALSCSALLVAGCGAGVGDGEVDEGGGAALRERAAAYRDVEDAFASETLQERWFEMRRGLDHDFDDVCGDTFCEGDFTNLTSMRFRCSVSSRTGQLKSCLWLFAGSYESVTASTGNVRPTAKFFSCAIPMTGTPQQLTDVLLAPGEEGPLHRALPGGTRSIYDYLGDCL